MIKITFPDGSVREYNEGVNGLQIARKYQFAFGARRTGVRSER